MAADAPNGGPPHDPMPWPDFPDEPKADPLIPYLPPPQDAHDVPADAQELTSASGHPGLAKGTKLGRYFILDKLGEGGMGVVYSAYDPELDRKIALKILSARFSRKNKGSSAQARLLREAQAMARVSHPNVIAVHDVGMVNDQIFVAMELVDGGTLNRWFRDTPRTWREILHTFVDAGNGLAAAHAVGLVHRDFKPDNVLISKDGRVRVTDFGLARLVTGGPDEEHVSSSSIEEEPVPVSAEDSARMLETPLTQVGAVMGTPAYMSPEQHLGRVPDARSDQFSFCAALYWALFRKRPFDPQVLAAVAGRNLGAPSASGTKVERPNLLKERSSLPGKGIILDPPKEPKVPNWLKRALMRGLAIAPDDRFPSMEALLGQLKRDPRVIPRRYVLWATGALVASLVAVTYQQVRQRQELCSGAELKLAGVWDGEVRRAIDKVFQGVGKPWAAQASSKLAERFDAQAREWAAMHKEACEATRIRGEQSEQLLSLRMICLDRRLGEFRALSELIRRDPAVLEKAVDAAYALTSVKTCADVAALLAPVPRPEDPKVRERVASIEKQLAEVKAQFDSGKYKQAEDEARAAASAAQETRFAPVEAEALSRLGMLQDVTGDPKTGEKTLRRALLAAEAGRHDLERFNVAANLVWTVGYSQRRFDDAQEWVATARAILTRLGGNPELEMNVLSADGAVLLGQGRYDDAVDRFRRAVELADQYLPAEHPTCAVLRGRLAHVYSQRGDLAEASKLDEDALTAIERLRGPEHPSAAYIHVNLAILRRDAADFASAHHHIARALEIFRSALGPNHSMVATSLDYLVTILQKEGRYAEALAEAHKSLEIRQKVLGLDHLDVAYSYENIGQALLGLDKAQDALTPLQKAIALKERNGLDAGELAEPRFALAKALWTLNKDRKRARALAQLARDGYAQAGNMAPATEVAAWLQDHP